MKRISKTVGLALAASACALFATGCSTMCGAPQDATVKCAGVNACKGSSECATPENSCKGQNKCRGAGWVYMSQTDCEARGGSMVE